LVDFDGDGRLDLLSGSNCCDANGLHLFRRRQNGSWAPRRRLEMTGKVGGWRRTSFGTAADWNGDGVPDLLVVAANSQGIVVALGPFKQGTPIALSQEIDFTPKGLVTDFAVADWDRDGKPDLLVRQRVPGPSGKEGIYWFRNLGGAGLPKLAEGKLLLPQESLAGKDPSRAHIQGFCVCDWNGDGWPDLIVTRDELVPGNTPDKRGHWRGSVWLYLRE
jgi:hypothetical protein